MLAVSTLAGNASREQAFTIKSPDGKLTVTVRIAQAVSWSIAHEGDVVLDVSTMSMAIQGGEVLGKNPRPTGSSTRTVNQIIASPLYNRSEVVDHYNELSLRFRGGYSLEFRAYNDGAAYRFVTSLRGDIRVSWEECNLNFAQNHMLFAPYLEPREQDSLASSFESLYQNVRLADFDPSQLSYTPIIVDIGNGKRAALLEADLEDYPGMFLRLNSSTKQGFVSYFARYPLEQKQGGHNNLQAFVTRRADYIARTKGSRAFPWRAVVVSTHDKQLADSDMVYKLAAPTRIDVSWIKPGKVAWDWWNDWNISGVDFVAGINNATYKYYIDFAAANGIEYIMLDEGWSASSDLMKPVPNINLEELIAYATQRNVGIHLWAGWLPLNEKMDEVMSHYSRMGIKGLKVDFMDRDDQEMVRFFYKVAQKAADNRLMINFHGSYKPTGWQRTYPNVITSEGVRGLEYQKWERVDAPRHNVSIPFIRMLAGPLDYTPGAMKNANIHNFRPIHSAPMSQGTRCHQLAMYVVYESPLSMLADNPTNYLREQESVDFIRAIPTVFDQTVAIKGSIGEYVAIARRKGSSWYVGAMTNWEARELTLNFSFLPPGEYTAIVFRDGANAQREATDYVREVIPIASGQEKTIRLSTGGGWAAIITKKE